MSERFARGFVRGTMAALLGSALIVTGAALAQEKTERADEPEHGVRVIAGAPGAVFLAGQSGAYLGVRLAEVDDEAVGRLGLSEERGALVLEVVEGTPAEKAGLQPDDVIVSWNEARVESAAQLSRLVRETPPGRTVQLGIVRAGGERTIAVELAERAGRFRVRTREGPPVRLRVEELLDRARERGDAVRAFSYVVGRPRLGVSVTNLTEQLGEYFGAEEGKGALVTQVYPDTPAAEAGLRAGDVILSVAGEEVDGPGDISRILRDRNAGPVEVRILRDREPRTLTAELEEPQRGPEGSALLAPHLRRGPGATLHLDAPLHLQLAPLPSVELQAVPMPPLPDIPTPPVEIDVVGIQEALSDFDWEAYADQWREWAERWEEQAADWEEQWREWAEQWEEQSQGWEARWEEQAAEWAEQWGEQAADWEAQWREWAEQWEDQAAEWREEFEGQEFRPDVIEVGAGEVILL